jgi:hypothetical protein
VLAGEDKRVGEQIESYGEPATIDTHHEFVLFQVGAPFVENRHKYSCF